VDFVSCGALDSRERQKYASNGAEIDATQTTKTTTFSNRLDVGWGGRTRTSEWRNQKSPERFDLTKLFSQLMVKARMSHQRVMSNFPTAPVGGVRRNQAMTENALPSPAAVRMRLHRDRRRKSFAV
jgi:hypothetical protein